VEQALSGADDHGHDPEPDLVDEAGAQEGVIEASSGQCGDHLA
jgi:hypothetical protein